MKIILQLTSIPVCRLKNRILELEEDFKESESKLRQALISRDDDADIAKDKFQVISYIHKMGKLKKKS